MACFEMFHRGNFSARIAKLHLGLLSCTYWTSRIKMSGMNRYIERASPQNKRPLCLCTERDLVTRGWAELVSIMRVGRTSGGQSRRGQAAESTDELSE